MKALNYYLLTLMIFSFTTVNAQKQITGRVINERTNEAIPFATVTILDTKKGANVDGNGVFTFKWIENITNDTLLFVAVGYIPLKRALSDLTASSKVYLQEDVKTLKEVNINDKRKEMQIGNYNITNHMKFHNSGVQMAKRFEMPATHQYLKEISIMRDPSHNNLAPETRFRINIYSENPETKGPGERICLDTIEVNDVNSSEIRIDVSKYNISITSNPFFVAIETLLIPINERYYLYRAGKVVDGIKERSAYYEVLYQPFFNAGRSSENEGWIISLTKPKWGKHQTVPAIKIIVN